MKTEKRTPARKARPADSPYSAGSPASSRYSQSPAISATRKRKSPKKDTPMLDQPLSVVTQEYDIPLKDISAWVHRPAQVRLQEVRNNNGRIARPMNSFMLYRSAYAQRVKRFCQEDNHQIVSKVTGASWQIEPRVVREEYERYAAIERDNHSNAHPDYKFSPNKGGRKRTPEVEDSSSDDGEWDGSSRSAKRSRAAGHDSSRSQSSTPFEEMSHSYHNGMHAGMMRMNQPQLHSSSYRASNPYGPEPRQYLPHGAPFTYIPHHYHMMESNVNHHIDDSHLSSFEQSHNLVGLPYADSHDLVVQAGAAVQPSSQTYPSPITHQPFQLDPQLAEFEGGYHFPVYDETYAVSRNQTHLYIQPGSNPISPQAYMFLQSPQSAHPTAPPQQSYHHAGAPLPQEHAMHPGDLTLTTSPTESWTNGAQRVADFDREFSWA